MGDGVVGEDALDYTAFAAPIAVADAAVLTPMAIAEAAVLKGKVAALKAVAAAVRRQVGGVGRDDMEKEGRRSVLPAAVVFYIDEQVAGVEGDLEVGFGGGRG